MGREDDREYWRREDERRERDREVWREQDLRDEDRHMDRVREDRQRTEEIQEAWRSLRRGNTAWALRNLAGPDAAISYLNAMERSGAGSEPASAPADEPAWPKHAFVQTLAELVENVGGAPRRVQFAVEPPDSDGDVLVRALDPEPFADSPVVNLWTSLRGGVPYRQEYGKFWVRRQLLAALPPAVTALDQTRALIRDLAPHGGR